MPTLAVGRILLDSYRDLARYTPVFLRLAAIPWAATLATSLLSPPAPPPGDMVATLTHGGIVLAAGTLGFVLTLPMVTAWHRLIVLGPDHPRAAIAYRFGLEELIYLRQALVLMLLAVPVAVVGAAVLGLFFAVTGAGEHTLAITRSTTFTTALQVAAIALIAPRFILLPGAAIGERTRLRDSRTLLRQNVGRMRLLVVLAWMPQVPLQKGIDALLAGPTAAVARSVVGFVVLAISVGVLSHAYVRVTGRVLSESRRQGG